mmetsp:Transcript_97116/g.280250  ORF Transcript_97116/g.280250 Transcript_97116/m.280250 type:complete len:204 (+) Transcript_97116:1244-1855(+)
MLVRSVCRQPMQREAGGSRQRAQRLGLLRWLRPPWPRLVARLLPDQQHSVDESGLHFLQLHRRPAADGGRREFAEPLFQELPYKRQRHSPTGAFVLHCGLRSGPRLLRGARRRGSGRHGLARRLRLCWGEARRTKRLRRVRCAAGGLHAVEVSPPGVCREFPRARDEWRHKPRVDLAACWILLLATAVRDGSHVTAGLAAVES